MTDRRPLVLSLVLLASSLTLGGASASDPDCTDLAPPALDFEKPIFIDKTRAGGEPVSIVAQDGSISVSAHAGTTHVYKDPAAAPGAPDFAMGYTNQTLNWRSTDGGDTWQYVGIPLLREGPHSATSTGFSDPDFAMDADGRIYNVEIDLANVSVFSSVDDGQSYTFANPEAASGDRPWLTAGAKDEVFLYVNLPRMLFRSTDGGLTWRPQNLSPPVSGKILNDPLNFESGLIGPVGSQGSPDGIAISNDEGTTWEIFRDTDIPGPAEQIIPPIAVDAGGTVYMASGGGYRGPSDTTPDGEMWFNYFDRSTKRWGEPVQIPTPPGDVLWPWVVAGDDGRVAVTWYQTLAGKPNEFYIYAAYTTNGHGSTVTCSDGTTRFVPPRFSVVDASKRPIHVGAICLSGTACNANTSYAAGDRRLGDFFTINFDANGDLFIASADTTLRNVTGGPKPVGNPIFIKQSEGLPLLEEPRSIRKSRCLFPIPSC